MRVYCHFKAEFALVFDAAPLETVGGLLQRFAAAAGGGRLQLSGAQTLKLRNERGETLPAAGRLFALLVDGEDLEVAVAAAAAAASAPAKAAAAAAPPPVKAAGGSSSDAALAQQAVQALRDSTQLMQQLNFRRARQLHRQVLGVDPNCVQALYQEGLIDLTLEDFGAAAGHFGRAAEHMTDDPELYLKLGAAAMGGGDGAKALQCFDKALGIAQRGDRKNDAAFIDGVKVMSAEALRTIGGDDNESAALQVVSGILRANEQHPKALAFYASIMESRGHADEALRVYLRLLVMSPNDDTIRKPFAALLQQGGSLEQLLVELPATQDSVAAYAFLATIAKDFSAIAEALKLYDVACRVDPTNANYTLNQLHVLELVVDYEGILQRAHGFLSSSHGRSARAGALAAADISQALGDGRMQAWKDGDAAPAGGSGDAGVAGAKRSKFPELTAEELDVLAIVFTVAKVCYVAGDIARLRLLLRLVSPEIADRKLHKTLVRNEAAYFGCVRQLIDLLPGEPAAAASPLYVVGDSHSLPLAWHPITIGGEQRLLRPMLVTGLKCWHMRPESTFYPKANLQHVVSQLPIGADCVFLFGEIDCREGLLVSVEKCRYKDVEEGVRVSVDIYIAKLLEVRKERKLGRMFVHPVPPVLDVTRTVVLLFNKVCKEKFDKQPSLLWLDFAAELLAEDGKLRSEYDLDGTHLSPAYISVMQTAIDGVL